MTSYPVLSLVIFLPLLGAAGILLFGKEQRARWIALATTLFAADGNPIVAKDLGDWRSWAVLGYIHDDEDRFVGIADLIVQTKVTAPLAETY